MPIKYLLLLIPEQRHCLNGEVTGSLSAYWQLCVQRWPRRQV